MKMWRRIGVASLWVVLAACGKGSDAAMVQRGDEDDQHRRPRADGGDDDDDVQVAADDDREPVSTEEPSTRRRPPRLGAVTQALRSPPAISGGTLAISGDGAFAVASDPDRDAVFVTRLSDRRVQRVSLPRGAEPGRVAIDGSQRAHVALRGTGKLVSIELAEAKLSREVNVCTFPRGLAYEAARDSLLVACADGELVSYDAASYLEQSRRFLARDLRDVVVDSQGRLLVSRFRSAELLQVERGGSVIARTAPPIEKDLRFVSSRAPMSKPPSSPRGKAPPGPPANADIMEEGGPREFAMRPTMAWRLVAQPGGEAVMLHQRAQIDEVVAEPGGYGGPGVPGCSGITQVAFSRVGPDAVDVPGSRIANATLAVDLALSGDGQWVAVAAPGNYLQGGAGVQVYSTSTSATGDDVPVEVTDAGAVQSDAGIGQPSGVGCRPPIVSLAHDSQVTAVAFGSDGQLFAQSREPAQLLIFGLADALAEGSSSRGANPNGLEFPPVDLVSRTIVELDEVSVRDSGHDLFHADVGGGLACASCHGEATDDGHVWTFAGIGPRRTQSMRGGLLGSEPFHWEGDMLTFQHLVDEVMTGRMSGFPVDAPFAAALAQWIDLQPALTPELAPSASSERGRKIFESKEAKCASCHEDSRLTDRGSVDVGTGGLFQVPSLSGLALRAPYMHDGCAETLFERFEPGCGGGDRHGSTSQLDETQVADLVAYLETL